MSIQQLFFTGDVAVATDPYWQYVQILFQPGGADGDTTTTGVIDSLDGVTWTEYNALYPVTVSGFSPYLSSYPYTPATQAKSYLLGNPYFTNTGTQYQPSAASRTISTFNGQQDFTIECWFYYARTASSNNNSFNLAYIQRASSPSTTPIGFYVNEQPGHGLYLYPFAGGLITVNNETEWNNQFFPPMSWNHLAFVRDGSNYKYFVNGKLIATRPTSSFSPLLTDYDTVKIGVEATQYFASYFVCDSRLVAGTAVYTSDFTPPTQPLLPITGTKFLLNGSAAKLSNVGYQAKGIASGFMSEAPFASYPSFAVNTAGSCAVSSNYSLYNQGSLYAGNSGVTNRRGYYRFKGVNISDLRPQTFEGWFYFPPGSTYTELFCACRSYSDPTNTNNLAIYCVRGNDSLSFGYPTGGGFITYSLEDVNCGFTTGVWYHIAIHRATNKVTSLWVNGVFIANGSAVGPTFQGYFGYDVLVGTTSGGGDGMYVDSFRYTSSVSRYTAAGFTPEKFPSQGVGANGGLQNYGQILYPKLNAQSGQPYNGNSTTNQIPFDFIVPANVTSISAVCIGCGGSAGGGGGGLCYGTFSVTPGEVLKLKVGKSLSLYNYYHQTDPLNSGTSSIYRSNGTMIMEAAGGSSGAYRYGQSGGIGGGYFIGAGVTNSGGGNGGYGGAYESYYSSDDGITYAVGAGGGGAAGYTGPGGYGGNAIGGAATAGTAGNGGGGGGGGGGDYQVYEDPECGTDLVYSRGGWGGGTGLFGQKLSGTGGNASVYGGVSVGDGQPGSIKNVGATYNSYPIYFAYGGGSYGGSGGGEFYNSCNNWRTFYGGSSDYVTSTGGIRLIWGTGRYYPNTNTDDIPTASQPT